MNRTIRIAAAALALAAGLAGCDLQPDAGLSVTVEVTGVDSRPDADRIGKELTAMIEGPVRGMNSTHSGGTLTVVISPVKDVEALVRKIRFGTVTSVTGRTVRVAFGKVVQKA